jgi:hypothetical protein
MLKSLIERWNGRAWKVVPSPSPGGAYGDNTLTGVAASGSSSAWAVGFTQQVTGSDPRDPTVTTKTLILHWNGRAWKEVASPSPGGSRRDDSSGLSAIASAGSSNAWAVGSYRKPGTYPKTLILHWNGRGWKQVASPDPRYGGSLSAVAVTRSGDAWAVGNRVTRDGQGLIEHWNGHGWKQVPSPIPPGSHGSDLHGVTAVGASDAWAVGDYAVATKANTDLAVDTLIERWNGRRWKQVSSPNPGGSACCHGEQNSLDAVAAAPRSGVWAAGSYSAGSAFGQTLIEGRTGREWTVAR